MTCGGYKIYALYCLMFGVHHSFNKIFETYIYNMTYQKLSLADLIIQ